LFSVGLQTGSGPVEVGSTKDTYEKGEGILILGSTGENVLLTISLIDPDGNTVKTIDTFSNSDGVFSESSFRIPTDAKSGTWIINAKSGPNFGEKEITVIEEIQEGLIVSISEIENTSLGKTVNIVGFGAHQGTSIFIKITSSDGVEIADLTIISKGDGSFSTIWLVPKDAPPGMYSVNATDSFNTANTTFELER